MNFRDRIRSEYQIYTRKKKLYDLDAYHGNIGLDDIWTWRQCWSDMIPCSTSIPTRRCSLIWPSLSPPGHRGSHQHFQELLVWALNLNLRNLNLKKASHYICIEIKAWNKQELTTWELLQLLCKQNSVWNFKLKEMKFFSWWLQGRNTLTSTSK